MIAFQILGVVAHFVIMIVLNGWTITILWGWFITKTFGLPLLNIPQALGLSLIVAYMTHQWAQQREMSFGMRVAASLAKMAFALIVGKIITLFM
jgi:hypothetical protein